MFFAKKNYSQERIKAIAAHPRPQFRRDSYLSLNGPWEFALDQTADHPGEYPDVIQVPFAVETKLSGIARHVGKTDVMHYRKTLVFPRGFLSEVTLLHFDAVDQICDVYFNGEHLAHHEGGYLPFEVELKGIKPGENEIRVDVTDDTDSPYFPRGKQSNEPGGIWYTPTSGIYGEVWIESVRADRLTALKITPNYEKRQVTIGLSASNDRIPIEVKVTFEGKTIAKDVAKEKREITLDLGENLHPWNPENPSLYDLEIKVGKDVVHSYFGLRDFASVDYEGNRVVGINGKPTFLSGPLDQGYWQESGLTAPDFEALLFDLTKMKKCGFNMIRKHIKIEPMRWYALCDALGLVVMQDIVSGGFHYSKFLITTAPFIAYKFKDTSEGKHRLFGRGDQKTRQAFEDQLAPTVELLYNVPSLGVWTIFNEGWGQFDTKRIYNDFLRYDATRLVDANSGWYDQHVGDFNSRHIYFRKIRVKNDQKRILSISEFGGYACEIEGHTHAKKKFAYKYCQSIEDFTASIEKLYRDEIIPAKKAGLSVAVYTQLSDVEEEINGLLTFDRAVLKLKPEQMKKINEDLKFQ